MAISISVVVLLAIAVWALYRYDNMRIWHATICVLFGFYLATTAAAPAIRQTLHSLVDLISGQH
jgi:uncharacterized membrane protein YqjE